MDEKTIREAFELWAKKTRPPLSLMLSGNGNYLHEKTSVAYRGFLACYQHLAPQGYVIVPKVPTEEMNAAAVRTIGRCTGNDDFPSRVWAAMIDAARKQEKKTC